MYAALLRHGKTGTRSKHKTKSHLKCGSKKRGEDLASAFSMIKGVRKKRNVYTGALSHSVMDQQTDCNETGGRLLFGPQRVTFPPSMLSQS